MLDSSEQKKGGFGAFAERERDRAETRAEERTGPSASVPDALSPSGQAADVGADVPAAAGTAAAAPTPGAPRRRRYFGFLLP
jgi:hypothetical protein